MRTSDEQIYFLFNEIDRKLKNHKRNPSTGKMMKTKNFNFSKDYINKVQQTEISPNDVKTIKDELSSLFLSYKQNIDNTIQNFKKSIYNLINERNQFNIDNRNIDNLSNNKHNNIGSQFVLKTEYSKKITELENNISNLNINNQVLKHTIDSNNMENQKKIEENKKKILSLTNTNNVENSLINKNKYVEKNDFFEKTNEI